jgi:hypothetical protein
MGILGDPDSTLDMDSHADIAVLGMNCRIIYNTGRLVQVYGYDPSQGPTTQSIVTGCFSYDDPGDGTIKILVVHQGVHVPGQPNSLIPPNQMRDNDIVVNDCPKSMKLNPTSEDHSLILQGHENESYQLPLTLRGTISCLQVRYPTDEEFSDETLDRYELTYETPEWNHADGDRADVEDTLAERLLVATVQGTLTRKRWYTAWERCMKNALVSRASSKPAAGQEQVSLRSVALLHRRPYGWQHPMAALMMHEGVQSIIHLR